MEFKDYYQTLGVEKTATAEEIKKAYRKKARKYHPDVSSEPYAEERMKDVNEANEVLSDPEKRSAYDRLGSGYKQGQNFDPPPNWDDGFEYSNQKFSGQDSEAFSDFFSNLFRNQRQQGSTQGNEEQKGGDRHAKISIDLKDSYLGATQTITLQTSEFDEKGRPLNKEHSLNIKIPKGIKEKQIIRLVGQGATSYRGQKPGDLYLEVHFKSNAQYRIDNKDVYQTIPVAPWEAALGATIKIPTPIDFLDVKIPLNSNNGKKLRLKEKGIPGNPPGDLYITLEVALPEANTDEAKKIYENMAKELAFNPRQKLGV
jgi:curved DNA-binding protein